MSAPLRSKRGCWTCRLRKKKCDEGRPTCATCESLAITCYGFGQKPEWMADDEARREIMENMKEVVKQTSRPKAATRSSKRSDQAVRLAPKSSSNTPPRGSSLRISSNSRNPSDSASDLGYSNESTLPLLQHGRPTDPLPHQLAGATGDAPFLGININDSVLLMHFLDNVFPLQYPMYKPEADEGGRGWLLSLLLQTESFYHAALALSAYHRREVMNADENLIHQAASLDQPDIHIEICLRLLRESAQHACQINPVGIAASVIQMVFFEASYTAQLARVALISLQQLFTGHQDAWKPHLTVALRMCQQALTSLSFNEEFTRIPRHGALPLQYEPFDTGAISSKFFRGALFWLDITSSLTAGTAPFLLPYYDFIYKNYQSLLKNITGCDKWVMIRIGRIAALHEQKSQALAQDAFNFEEFNDSVIEIRREIQHGLTQETLQSLDVFGRDKATCEQSTSDTTALITHVFANMALVYLHLVAEGYHKLELIDTYVSATINMLQNQNSHLALSALICPIFIIGSAARTREEGFFRTIFCSPPLLDPCLRHRQSLLPILERIWRRRELEPTFTWKDSLDLTENILLL